MVSTCERHPLTSPPVLFLYFMSIVAPLSLSKVSISSVVANLYPCASRNIAFLIPDDPSWSHWLTRPWKFTEGAYKLYRIYFGQANLSTSSATIVPTAIFDPRISSSAPRKPRRTYFAYLSVDLQGVTVHRVVYSKYSSTLEEEAVCFN